MMQFAPTVFAGHRYAVLGLGRYGLPAARALVAMGAEVTVWDDTETARAAADGLVLADPRGVVYDALVLSPGIPHRLPAPHPAAADAIVRGLPILTDADLLYQAVRACGSRARFVGITGTNGKSTTTALLAHILACAGREVAAGGNLGPAALALPLLGNGGVYCLEMSSYMLERLAALRFDAAAMLNLSPDHLDRHGDMQGYARAKRAIFDRQRGTDVAVLGIDDAESRRMADTLTGRRIVRISGCEVANIWADGTKLRDGDDLILDLADAPALPGSHNAQNAAAAAALASVMGVARSFIAAGIASFPGLPHRQQRVATRDGIVFVNDSKATNADATARALACYDRVIWIAGGMGKEGGIESLAPHFSRVAEALLIGRDAPQFAATLAAHGVRHRIMGTLDGAVEASAGAAARLGADVVLLSPAAASWDQFANFEQRGEHFTDLARGLALPARESCGA
jgi:UDP-N-acetylmuramoylalanine--D-glutamate ligase